MTKPAGGLRFAIVSTFYPPYSFGGDGSAIRRLVHALARRHHTVDVIHDVDAFHTLSNALPSVPQPEPPGVRVHALRSAFGQLSCLATQQLGRPVVHGGAIRRILSQGFDVIHFHNISLVGGPGLLSYGEGIKLYTAHEHWLVCPSHVLWRHNRELCTGRECVQCVLHYRRPPQIWRATGYLERQTQHIDEFLTLSQFARAKHAEFGFTRPMTVVPAFLAESSQEHPGAQPAAARDDTAPAYFLFVGRLEKIKGLQDVIPQFHGGEGAQLRIAGTGEFEHELRALAAGSPRIRFLGRQSAEQLSTLYRNAIAVILPSVCFEVFPMVVLEAFREGTPIIARSLGPFPEIVEQSQAGLLFRTESDLQAAITGLASDLEQRNRLGKAAEVAFHTHWREPVVMDQYFDIIRRIAERRGLRDVLERLDRSAAARP
ncbi:MAG: glycosyltransferase family 4 protein [Gemmatimonadota bacterium]